MPLNIHYISPWTRLLQTHCNMHAVYFKHVVICTPYLHNLESLLNVSNSCCLKNNINIINIYFYRYIYKIYILPPAVIIQQNRSTYCMTVSPSRLLNYNLHGTYLTTTYTQNKTLMRLTRCVVCPDTVIETRWHCRVVLRLPLPSPHDGALYPRHLGSFMCAQYR